MNLLKVFIISLVVGGVFGGKYLLGVSHAEDAKKVPVKESEHKGHDHEGEKEESHDHAGEKEEAHGEKEHAHSEGEKHEEKEGESHAHKEGEEKGEGHAHGEGEEEGEHGEEGEEGGVIGPDKGITAKGPNGFTLSKEAWASFEIKIQEVDASSVMPKAALVQIKDGKFYYRIRKGWIKRVPYTSKFQQGDQVIVGGTGFVRTAELVVEEGVSHGHSH